MARLRAAIESISRVTPLKIILTGAYAWDVRVSINRDTSLDGEESPTAITDPSYSFRRMCRLAVLWLTLQHEQNSTADRIFGILHAGLRP